jgi:putative ABC transport system substrate-binding protein
MANRSKRGGRAGIWLAALALFLGSAWTPGPAAETPPVAVLYPDVREPYRSVFLNIVRGIEEGLKGSASQYALGEGDDLPALGTKLAREQVGAVIALGRVGLHAARKFPSEVPVVVGAVLMPPGPAASGLTGITLTPDPKVLFGWLQALVPAVKRVTVVYNRNRDESGIEQAREAARLRGVVLNALPADNIRAAAALYRDFLGQHRDGSDALWLPQEDSILDENALLPLILKEAWDSNLVVFSSNPEHVKKGALFSLFPDNRSLGRSLAELALARMDGRQPPTVLALKDLLIAVNARTAEHLGLRFTSQEKRKFDLIFPSP